MNSISLILISILLLGFSINASSYDEKVKRHPSPEDIISRITVHKHRWADFMNKTEKAACNETTNNESCLNDFQAYKRTEITCEPTKKPNDNNFTFDACMIKIESYWLSYKQAKFDETGKIPNAKSWHGYCLSSDLKVIRICR
jgi:hypothetical protein